jgi:uncharacterized protein (TIGR03067 family)
MICVLLLLTTPLLLAADAGDDVRKELKALQGKWKTVAVEAGGRALPKEAVPDFTFVVGAHGKAKGQFAKGEIEFTMTIDPSKKPKTIENMHTGGAEKGKTQYGIYKLEGDKFTVCVVGAGSPKSDRPKDFDTTDPKRVLFVFERVKKDE